MYNLRFMHAKCSEEHQTALMWSAAEGHLSCLKCLINKDAKIDTVVRRTNNEYLF